MNSLLRLAAVCAALSCLVTAPARAAWYEAKSKHFIIDANENPDELRAYAQKLERFDQAVRYFYQMPDPPLTDAGRVTILVVPDVESIQALMPNSGAAGFYRTAASGSFAFIPHTTDFTIQGMSGGTGVFHETLSPQEIFFHEYTHHLQLQDSTVALPMWVAEGYAEFFATAEINKDGSVTFGKFPAYRSWGVHDRDSITMEEIVGETFGNTLYSYQMDTLYGRAWLLVHYLMMTESRHGQLGRYVDNINKGMSALDAGKAAFGDLKQLDRDLDAYLAPHKLLGVTVSPDVLSVGDIAVRPLNPAESAIVHVRMRSKAGAPESTAPSIAAEARGVAAKFPTDPSVQSALAEAELDAKNYAAASTAADAALAADPKNVRALIYKGRAQMELAKANAKSADWDGVREWFLKANKLDTENAEPLFLFYRTYAEARQPLTQNAVDALLYAVELAPQDYDARITAVGQLLAENKLDEAKSMFAPVAFRPHADQQSREQGKKIMDAIVAGDGKLALKLLQEPHPGTKTASK